ncbi:hypothetical protein conserved [Leishmania donovani]|nr:hypothetical protein conserved [Leishmania donovani]
MVRWLPSAIASQIACISLSFFFVSCLIVLPAPDFTTALSQSVDLHSPSACTDERAPYTFVHKRDHHHPRGRGHVPNSETALSRAQGESQGTVILSPAPPLTPSPLRSRFRASVFSSAALSRCSPIALVKATESTSRTPTSVFVKMSALSERLVMQLLRIRNRELELETKQQELDSKLRQEEDLRKELEVEQEKLAKLRSVQETLEKMNEGLEAKYKAVKEDDELQRKQISEELKKRIAEVDEVSRELAEREQRAQSRKELLLKQQEIYDQHSNSGKEKFDELVAKRASEIEALTKKKDDNIRRTPELRKQLETETEQLTAAKAQQMELQAKVNEFLNRFSIIQSQLNEAKRVYESASTDKDRSTRMLKALESDLEMLRRRAATSKAERDKELAKVTALTERMEAVRSQINTFENITKMLTMSDDGDAAAGATQPRQ